MLSGRALVIEPAASHLAWAVFTRARQGCPRFESLGRHPFDPAAWREGRWADEVTRAVRMLRPEFRRLPAAIAVPGFLTLTKYVRTPVVAKARREQIVRFEAEQNIPQSLDEMTWGDETIGERAGELHLVLGAARDADMERLCAAVEASGVAVVKAVPACLALREALRAVDGADGSLPRLLVDVGARSTHVVLVDGSRFATRTLAMGGELLTQSIAATLRLPPVVAEELKLGRPVSGGEENVRVSQLTEVERMTAQFERRLHLEVVRSVEGLVRQWSLAPPAIVHLTGRGIGRGELNDSLRGVWGVRVERFDARRSMDLTGRAMSEGIDDGREGAMLLGLAAMASRREARRVDLLPRRRKAARAFVRRQPAWFMTAAIVVLGLVPPCRHFDSMDRAARAERERLEATLAAMRDLRMRMDERLVQVSATERRLAALRNAVEARTAWESLLADFEERLARVGNVWLDRLAPRLRTGGDAVAEAGEQLVVSGRLIDVTQPRVPGSAESLARVRRLIAELAQSPFVASVSERRFDVATPGVVGFELAIELDRRAQL